MRIGIAFDLVPDDRIGDGPDDRYEEFDRPETVAAIADAIRGAGHDVVLMGDGRQFLVRALDDPPDFVFNIAEGEGTSRNREARIPAACEMLGIPYSGSDPLTLAAALDKGVARRLVGEVGVRVPRGLVVYPYRTSWFLGHPDWDLVLGQGLERDLKAYFPLVIKPAFEGSSKGIRGRCLASNADEARVLCRRLFEEYDQPVLLEQYIAGDEVTVGFIDERPYRFLGAMRIVPRDPSGPFIYSLEVKRDYANRVFYEAPPELDSHILERLHIVAVNVFGALGCRDVARIDFRVRDGVPYFIEANPLPGLNPKTSDLVILARGHGIAYNELIQRILNTALRRVGLLDSGAATL